MTDSRIVDRQLSLARQGLSPPAALRARVRGGLAASNPVAQGTVARGNTIRDSMTRGAVAAALLALGFGGGYLAHSRDVEPAPPLPVRALSPVEAVTLEVTLMPPLEASADDSAAGVASALDPGPVSARTAVARSNRSSSVRTPVAPASTPASTSELASQTSEQLTLLQRAERAVRAENPALAIALVTEHAERYPHSPLVEERQAIELMAHCEAGAVDASERARLFLQEQPKSVYASRVRELCWVEPAIDRAER